MLSDYLQYIISKGINMINILLCGNKKVFDGALTQLLSITNKTKETINCYIFTMDVSRINPEYTCITDEQVDFLESVIKEKKAENSVIKVDVTDIYEQEFGKCKNETAYCTPYTLLRLLADLIPDMPNKILYLDIDMMINGDLAELYNIDVTNYEYAAVKEKYGSIFIWPDYINAGMLLLNMEKIRETGLLEKARHLIKTKKMLFADQDAIYRATTSKLLLPRKYNEQSSFKREDTIVCHFCKRLMLLPYPHTENFKQWQIDDIHRELKCFTFDEDLKEYKELKEKYNTKTEEKVKV
jgi:lipopolysaccharide biosynthesis glycosyltransferase